MPPSVYEGLRAVSGLRFGRSNAREADPVRPVPDADIVATLRFLPPIVADMVRLQRITGMRSDNLVTLRPCDLDRTADVWVYEPVRHKTQHHRRKLFILIGPKARAILEPCLSNRSPAACCFSPAEVAQWQIEQRKTLGRPRKTRVYPCEARRLAREKLARCRLRRERPPGDRYTPASYRRAITYAINKAKGVGISIGRWHPHQLRHTMATEVRKQYGVEGAQLALGHSKANITEVYAERDLEFAKRIAQDRLISSQAELAVGKCLTKEASPPW